jgi:hypothetical protein
MEQRKTGNFMGDGSVNWDFMRWMSHDTVIYPGMFVAYPCDGGCPRSTEFTSLVEKWSIGRKENFSYGSLGITKRG